MTRLQLIAKVAPVVASALANAEADALTHFPGLTRGVARQVYQHMVLNNAALISRLAVEVALTVSRGFVAPLLRETDELFSSNEPLHPAVLAAMNPGAMADFVSELGEPGVRHQT